MSSEQQLSVGEQLDRWLYNFRCPVCGASGKLGLPKSAQALPCPEGPPENTPEQWRRYYCGARFVQAAPMGQLPARIVCTNEIEARARLRADMAHHRPVRWAQ